MEEGTIVEEEEVETLDEMSALLVENMDIGLRAAVNEETQIRPHASRPAEARRVSRRGRSQHLLAH